MIAILEKISGNENAIRTKGPIEGFCRDLPVVDRSFSFFSEPLNPEAGLRKITTSLVQSFEWMGESEATGIMTFKTLNSQYRLQIKGERNGH
jgi:hypothetical protein